MFLPAHNRRLDTYGLENTNGYRLHGTKLRSHHGVNEVGGGEEGRKRERVVGEEDREWWGGGAAGGRESESEGLDDIMQVSILAPTQSQ